jgi:hypothetical protein
VRIFWDPYAAVRQWQGGVHFSGESETSLDWVMGTSSKVNVGSTPAKRED